MRLGDRWAVIGVCAAVVACACTQQEAMPAADAGLAAVAPAPPPAKAKLTLTGSSTIAPAMRKVATLLETRSPNAQVTVETGGSQRGIDDARNGRADIGMSSRALNPDETGLLTWQLGMDGVCFIVHEQNPVKELSEKQLASIFTAKTSDWAAVGGKKGSIDVVDRAKGRSEVELVSRFFKWKPEEVSAGTVAGENIDAIRAVASNPAAITYISVAGARHAAAEGLPIRLLPLRGIAATEENVRAGLFPLCRPLLLLTRGPPQGLAREFVDLAVSAEARPLLESEQLVAASDSQRQAALLLATLSHVKPTDSTKASRKKIAVVYQAGNRNSEASARAMVTALSGANDARWVAQPLPWGATTPAEWQGVAKEAGAVYVCPGAEPKSVITVARADSVLTFTGVEEHMGQGVAVGLMLRNDKPALQVNAQELQAEGATLDSALLRSVELRK